jgi:hypothetical protein
LFSQIPFPGPDVDAAVFDAEDIWAYIEQNAKESEETFTRDFITVCETAVHPTSLNLLLAEQGTLEPHNGS